MRQDSSVFDFAQRFYKAISDGDIDTLQTLTLDDDCVVMIGTDPQEWWQGFKEVTGAFRAQFQALGGGLQISNSNPQCWSEGNIGWFADQFKLGAAGTQVPCRLTCVVTKDSNGQWRMAHGHCSIGVSNQEAIGLDVSFPVK